MPLLERWKIGAGGFIGEVSLYALAETDTWYVKADCELTDFHVHPLRRGRGWGHVLLQTALKYADKRRLRVFLRAVPYGRQPAEVEKLVTLYRSYGFRPVRRSDQREMIREPRTGKAVRVRHRA